MILFIPLRMLSIIKTSWYIVLLLIGYVCVCSAQGNNGDNNRFQAIIIDSGRSSVIKTITSKRDTTTFQNAILNGPDSIYIIDQDRIKINLNTSKDVVIDVSGNVEERWIYVCLDRVGFLSILGNGKTHLVLMGNRPNLNYKKMFADRIKIINCIAEQIILPNSDMKKLMIDSTEIKYMNFSNANISEYFMIQRSGLDSSNFENAYLPEMLYLDRVRLRKIGSLDFNKLIYLKNTYSQALELERTLVLREVDLDRIRLPYDRFSFHVDSNQLDQHRVWIYQKILQHVGEEGQTLQYSIYNIAYKELLDDIGRQDFTNWISKTFWDRGRNKTKAVLVCLLVFSGFYVLNFLMWKYVRNVYCPKNFISFFNKKKALYRQGINAPWFKWEAQSSWQLMGYNVLGIFWYTTFIFWGLKLNLESIKFNNLFIVSYIILQYIVGLVVVAYIVSFVIIKL